MNEYISGLTKERLLIIMSVLTSYLLWLRYRYVSQFNKMTGTKVTLGLIGNINMILSNHRECPLSVTVHELITSIPKLFPKYNGGLFGLFIGPVPMVFVTTPESAQVALTHEKSQVKGQHYDVIRYALGDGLITSSSERWSSHRKLLTPAFHFKILQSLVSIVQDRAEILITRMQEEANNQIDSSVNNYQRLVSDFTLDVLFKSSMGINTKCQVDETNNISSYVRRAFEAFAVITVCPWMWIQCLLKFYSIGREYVECVEHIRCLSNQVIGRRIKRFKSHDEDDEEEESIRFHMKKKEPFIDIMIKEHLKNPSNFSIQDIVDETNIFLVAGHDTTAVAISYALLLIGHHPQVQAKIHQEIDTFFSEHSEEHLTTESLKSFIYLEAVMKESFRLYSPVPLISRVAQDDIVIDGYTVPKGTEILISIHLVHMNAKYWPDPYRFKPERFLHKLSHPYAFIPFSAGPRNCIGQKFAMIQSKMLIISILKHHTIQSMTQLSDITPRFAPVSTPIKPLQIRFLKR